MSQSARRRGLTGVEDERPTVARYTARVIEQPSTVVDVRELFGFESNVQVRAFTEPGSGCAWHGPPSYSDWTSTSRWTSNELLYERCAIASETAVRAIGKEAGVTLGAIRAHV